MNRAARVQPVRRKLAALAIGSAMLLGLSACGGSGSGGGLSCQDAYEAYERASERYDEYDGDSMDRRRDLFNESVFARGDALRACGRLDFSILR